MILEKRGRRKKNRKNSLLPALKFHFLLFCEIRLIWWWWLYFFFFFFLLEKVLFLSWLEFSIWVTFSHDYKIDEERVFILHVESQASVSQIKRSALTLWVVLYLLDDKTLPRACALCYQIACSLSSWINKEPVNLSFSQPPKRPNVWFKSGSFGRALFPRNMQGWDHASQQICLCLTQGLDHLKCGVPWSCSLHCCTLSW